MHPIPSLLLLLLLCFTVTLSFPWNCTQTFSCGPLHNLSYPFTGGPQPAHCGPPEFHLTCTTNDTDTPILTTDSLSYRVIQINQTQNTLTLSRVDLYDNTCSPKLANTTLNSTVYTPTPDNENLTIFYGCSSPINSLKPLNLFYCDTDGNYSAAYYLIGPVPTDPALAVIRCEFRVQVPVLETAADRLRNYTVLAEVLMEGFNVSYRNPYGDDCAMCRKFGWNCGFDQEFGGPICICGDQICNIPGNNKTVKLAVGILSGGIGVAFIFLGCWFLRWRWRKRKAAQSKSNELLPTPLSSQGLTTPSTNLSQSIPSYSTSNFDPEKGSGYFGAQVFSFTELEEATDNFDPSKELGDGGFGTVYYGLLKDGRVVAVKRLYENNFKRAEQFMTEVEILTRLRHPNLVTLYGCTSRRSRELLLVYEYIPNGTVADHLHGNRAKSGLLTWPIRLSIAVETANALAFLHASDVIHRDVKTNNILLDNNFRVKVADFGLSRLFPTDVTHVSTAPQGTPGYVDPEYYQCYQLTDKSDVYSFGVVLVELISSKEAVDTNRHRHDINLANMAVSRIQNHELHELVDPSLGFENNYAVRTMMTSVAELAFRCLQQERDLRPSMEEVLEVLKEIENEELGAQKAEVVDIRADDVGLLKNISPPLSPDSVVNDKWLRVRSL